MARNRLFGVLAATLFLFVNSQLNGCAKSSGVSNDVDLTYESNPSPPRIGLNTFTITLTGGNGERLAGARVTLEGDMSHAGMKPVFGEANEVGPGRYQGTLDLRMRGDWTVLFHITLPSGQTFDREMKIQNLQAT
jgi:YtkA-like